MLFTFHYVSIKSHTADHSIPHYPDLHSTMYLLNPSTAKDVTHFQRFTFHYVSIKSLLSVYVMYTHIANLHSTMYLLNLIIFIMHMRTHVYLHSTMYLLNPYVHYTLYLPKIFTFHYVSIKSVFMVSEC